MVVVNTPAYYDRATINAVKSFIAAFNTVVLLASVFVTACLFIPNLIISDKASRLPLDQSPVGGSNRAGSSLACNY
jgi:hypothetical protein